MDVSRQEIQKRTLKTRFDRFFFEEQIPYGIALVRIVVCMTLLIVVSRTWIHSREIFSTDGAPSPIWVAYFAKQYLPYISGTMAVALYSVLFCTLLTSLLGFCTRVSLGIATVLFFYFISMDVLSSMTKYSVISTHVLLILTLSRCGDVWSLDNRLKGRSLRRKKPILAVDRNLKKSQIWPQRLIQILIAVVYFGAAMTKIQTHGFFTGEQMQNWMLSDINYHNPIGERLALYPAFLVFSAYATLVWEIAFVFLVWNGIGRFFMLGIGLLFHIMTAVLFGLYIFPLIYFALYFSFLTERDMRKIFVTVRRLRKKLGWKMRIAQSQFVAESIVSHRPVLSGVLLSGILLLGCVVGVGLEHYLDPYGMRRAEGRYTLKEIPLEKARRMLAPSQPIRPQDKIFNLQTGTFELGGVIANPRNEFRYGETVIAQCTLNPPHEDFILQCNLLDSENRTIVMRDFIAPREVNRCRYYFPITKAIDPGKYFLVLVYRKQELLRKTIYVEKEKSTVVAN